MFCDYIDKNKLTSSWSVVINIFVVVIFLLISNKMVLFSHHLFR